MKLFSQQFSECRANDYCLERTFVPFKGNPKILPAFPNKKMADAIASGKLTGLDLIKCGKFGGVCSGANKKCKELRGVDKKGQGAGSDILGIISDARDMQARFLKERGTTIEEARNLPKTKQAKLQSDYEAWLKTEGGFRIPPQAGDTTGWKGTQDWRKAVDQVPDIEDKLDWLRAVANNRGSKATALDLSDALDKVESLRREWPEHSRMGNALWDIAQNPAASAETKARALAAYEDLLSHGGKFPAKPPTPSSHEKDEEK